MRGLDVVAHRGFGGQRVAGLECRDDLPVLGHRGLSSVAECVELIRNDSVTFIQPDAPRVGGITPFLKIAAAADLNRLKLAPHFVMEIHVHLACAYPHQAWVEHIEWLEPAFEERLRIRDGRMLLPSGPGLGFSLSGQAAQRKVTARASR